MINILKMIGGMYQYDQARAHIATGTIELLEDFYNNFIE
jgi:hypothetical protein